MQNLVRSLGFIAFVFESAEDFLRSPRVDDSSCLISDVQMQGMSGLDLQDCLIAQGTHIPTIFITAFPEQSVRSRAQAVAHSVFSKSRSPGALRSSWSARLSTYSQYSISSNVNGIKDMEAQTLNGISVQKIYFQPDVNLDLAIAQIVSRQIRSAH
jgi:DNA-binding NtrC family response regulator